MGNHRTDALKAGLLLASMIGLLVLVPGLNQDRFARPPSAAEDRAFAGDVAIYACVLDRGTAAALLVAQETLRELGLDGTSPDALRKLSAVGCGGTP